MSLEATQIAPTEALEKYRLESESLASQGGVETLGSIYTKPDVVNFMLDILGYTVEEKLFEKRVLEPSFGQGDFLFVIVDRLVTCWFNFGFNFSNNLDRLKSAIHAVELSKQTFHSTYRKLLLILNQRGAPDEVAKELLDSWLVQGDFLLLDISGSFDFVVGNPPYVRQDRIPNSLVEEYKRRYTTIYDRADIYIPFVERSLNLLKRSGAHVFICADRWMKNKYGRALRGFVAQHFALETYIDMSRFPAFYAEVSAYPAITKFTRNKQGKINIVRKAEKFIGKLDELYSQLSGIDEISADVLSIGGVINGSEPWLIESDDQMSIVKRLEADFPLIEEVGCKVGIGVATGADKIFLGDYDALEVEDSRKIPIAKPKDIDSGKLQWLGKAVVNPFEDDGSLVELNKYPKLEAYLNNHADSLKNRYVAKKSPHKWFKTIDKITASLVSRPKLLIPDIKGKAHVAYDFGSVYPHHNLYYVVSDTWDLEALQAILMSSIGTLFVAVYSTKMRGGFLRFQAQYLRRIRVPDWESVSNSLRQRLVAAARSQNIEQCNEATFELYGLTKEEQVVLGGNGVN